jgi:hypothetical protein
MEGAWKELLDELKSRNLVEKLRERDQIQKKTFLMFKEDYL